MNYVVQKVGEELYEVAILDRRANLQEQFYVEHMSSEEEVKKMAKAYVDKLREEL